MSSKSQETNFQVSLVQSVVVVGNCDFQSLVDKRNFPSLVHCQPVAHQTDSTLWLLVPLQVHHCTVWACFWPKHFAWSIIFGWRIIVRFVFFVPSRFFYDIRRLWFATLSSAVDQKLIQHLWPLSSSIVRYDTMNHQANFVVNCGFLHCQPATDSYAKFCVPAKFSRSASFFICGYWRIIYWPTTLTILVLFAILFSLAMAIMSGSLTNFYHVAHRQ